MFGALSITAGEGQDMRKLGIIGGMGWPSTALYYEHINRAVAQRLGPPHGASLVIESLDFATIKALESAGDWSGVGDLIGDSAARLEGAGAEGLAIACNTVHKCFDQVAARVSVP